MGKTSKIIEKNIKIVKNFPKKGILFQDIFSLTNKPNILSAIINEICLVVKRKKINKLIGIESRGFIFASAAALKCKLPFIAIRKPNKLPGPIYRQKYQLEYGTDEIQIQKGSVKKSDRVLIIDDLIATGGTALASIKLLRKLNKNKITCFFVINLSNLNGTNKLIKNNVDVSVIYETEG